MPLPPLPPLNDRLAQLMRGPTLDSNWVIPGMVMAGAYPGALEDLQNERKLTRILRKGIDTFVCLQAEVDDDIPEELWRTGQGLRPYFADADKLCQKQLKWLHLPMLDGNTAPDGQLENCVCDLVDDVKAGRVLYVHCWGGHGRTGTVACLLLAVLYGISAAEAFKRVQAYHDCRVEPQGVKSPSTVVQRNQVKRMLQKWLNQQPSPVTYDPLDPQSEANVDQPQVDGSMARAAPLLPSKRTSSLPTMAGRTRQSKEQLSKRHPSCLQKALQTNTAESFPSMLSSGRMHRSASASGTQLSTGRAAATGAACVQMMRKSTGKLGCAVQSGWPGLASNRMNSRSCT